MPHFDLCFAWNWAYDLDFARMLESACQAEHITIFQVTPNILPEVLEAVYRQELSFCAFFDRASDDVPAFVPLTEWAYRQDLVYINRFWLARRSWDKATMHHHFTRNGLDAPYTVVLPSYQENPDLPFLDLKPYGDAYALKPAHGGGGAGVVVGSLTWEQILEVRQEHPQDQYLLQARVVPDTIQGRPSWFRGIYCLDKVHLCWWDPSSHIYTLIFESEFSDFGLEPLGDICRRIAQLSHLELFSTEIALANNRFLVVDYINDPIDLRPKSRIPEGVPDVILTEITRDLARHIALNCLKVRSNAG